MALQPLEMAWGGMWKNLELCTREVLGCSKQNSKGYSVGSSEDQKAERDAAERCCRGRDPACEALDGHKD